MFQLQRPARPGHWMPNYLVRTYLTVAPCYMLLLLLLLLHDRGCGPRGWEDGSCTERIEGRRGRRRGVTHPWIRGGSSQSPAERVTQPSALSRPRTAQLASLDPTQARDAAAHGQRTYAGISIYSAGGLEGRPRCMPDIRVLVRPCRLG